ncbi:MAG: isochorismatase family protein [Clostridia bacterium]|nr:isochorismatase family protein [Clostridia bacterium]
MKKFLIVVDMQKDFVDGTLGTDEAVAIVPNVVNKIKGFDGNIICTFDTHFDNYLDSSEGKKLPVVHCIKDTEGWQLNAAVSEALQGREFNEIHKITFGSRDLPSLIMSIAGDVNDEDLSIELIGLCTDICVVSNALYLKANFPEAEIKVDSSCCAGVTPSTHNAALDTMRCCQIDVL